MNTDDVISAFIDNEPFDSADLARALAEPAGRELLLDLLALRAVLQDDSGITSAPLRPATASRPAWIAAGFLAASILFAIGSALLLPSLLEQPRHDVPPRPDRVVTFDTAGD